MTKRIDPRIREALQRDILNGFLKGSTLMALELSTDYDKETVKEMVRALVNVGHLMEYGRGTNGRMYRTTRQGRRHLQKL